MKVEACKKEIVLNQIIGQKHENRVVETDIIVNDVKPDVLNVISTRGIVNIYKKDIMDKKIRIDGAINTYIVYMADDEETSVRSLNTCLDFVQIIDMENLDENMDVNVKINVRNFDTKIINGRKLNIKANLDIQVNVYSNENIDIITGVENSDNIQILNSNEEVTSLIGKGENKVSAKDTISIDSADNIVEIMNVKFDIIDEETKISYNKVLSKADAVVEIMYLTEENRVNTVISKIPIMGFVDIENVNENCKCEIQNILTNLIIKPNTIEEHSIAIEIEVQIQCAAYETKKIDIIEDMYSINKEIKFDKKEINAVTKRNRIKNLQIIKENIRIPELTGRVLNILANPSITNMQIRNGKVIYEGNLNLNIMFENNNGINMQTVDLQFNFDIVSDDIEEKSNITTNLKIKKNDFIIKEGIIEITVEIEIDISEQKNRILSVINNVTMEDEQTNNMYSMVIYFVKPGDSLWKIAKKFKSTVEDIAKINDIENINKINIGEQLYIPRFCKCKVEI